MQRGGRSEHVSQTGFVKCCSSLGPRLRHTATSSLLPPLRVVMAAKPLQCVVVSIMLSGSWPHQNILAQGQLTVDRIPSVSACSPLMAAKPLQCVVVSIMLSGSWPHQNILAQGQLTVDRIPSVSACSPHLCLLSVIVVPKTKKRR